MQNAGHCHRSHRVSIARPSKPVERITIPAIPPEGLLVTDVRRVSGELARGIKAGMRYGASQPVRCVVVGGSLVGLSAAIALSRLGMDVTVFERSPARAIDGGGGLGVDVALLAQVTGIGAEPPVLHGIDRDTTAWHLLQGWLEAQAVRRSGVTVHRGTQVTAVRAGGDPQPASVVTQGDGEHDADLVIGADGARSTVRAAVDQQHPDARYAGVLLWRCLVEEQAMPAGLALLPDGEPSREVYAGPYRLVTYLVPGAAGETSVGHRRLNLVWYDPQQRDLLSQLGVLNGETIQGSLAPGTLPGPVRDRLAEFAAANWPSPWREALALALHDGTVFGTPIVHYEPARLARGRAALAGDAAHAASPMVGGGFRQGLYDVAALAQVLTPATSPAEIPGALARYQELRLPSAARHVAVSERATADYLAHATEPPAG
jgi:2-polyprenyl-6-methoxyphenol hydroxylase-like FAD-dependent oxidoreductase